MHEKRLRLSEFLRREHESILHDWEKADRQVAPAQDLSSEQLRDSLPFILNEIAEQADEPTSTRLPIQFPHPFPTLHAQQRLQFGFSLEDVSREYALLRKVLFERLAPHMARVDPDDLVFLNAALDRVGIQAVMAYSDAATTTLREAETRYRRIYESGIVGILEYHADGRMTAANDTFLQMVGYSRKDLAAGRLRILELTPPEYHAATMQALESLKTTGRMYPHEKQYIRKDGSRIDILVSGATLDEQNARGVVLVLDISARKQLEAKESQRRQFEQQFIGIVGHDLRSPLVAITLAASLLQRRQDLGARTKSVVTNIINAAERANRMIHDLLDLTQARLGGGIPVEREPGDVHALVAQVVEELRLSFPHRTIIFEQQGAGHGQWDADRMAQIVTNLVNNALTYSPADSAVAVRVGGDVAEVTLTVQNSGKPIPPELLPHLFESLSRGNEQGSSPHRNLGLGLFIVKHLVDAHQGTIDVQSTAEKGTTFTVRLPRQGRTGS